MSAVRIVALAALLGLLPFASGCRQIVTRLPDSMFCDHCACREDEVSLWRPVTCWEGGHDAALTLSCCPGAW